MLAIMFLPRQFQVAVIENMDERHLNKAIWLFPLYMLAINVFVLPIAFGGILHFPDGSVDADTFVLTLPMAAKQEGLALLVFIGGLSAATGMVIVETIALSTMVCNDLVMPVLLRLKRLRLAERRDLTGAAARHPARRDRADPAARLPLLPARRRGLRAGLDRPDLVRRGGAVRARRCSAASSGKAARARGALCGLLAGFAVWVYTLLLPALARSGWLPIGLLEHGPFGIALLKPLQLFGLAGLDEITHAMIWSMIANIGAYVGGVAARRARARRRHRQASLFVDVFRQRGDAGGAPFWRGTASAARPAPTAGALHRRRRGRQPRSRELRARAAASPGPGGALQADAELVHFVEMQLAGAIGAASARIMVASAVKEEALSIDEVREMLDEASQVIVYSHRLEQKSRELERATRGTARRQRAPEGARPAEGRFRLYRVARIAHAAHLDPRLLRDPARRPGPGARASARASSASSSRKASA